MSGVLGFGLGPEAARVVWWSMADHVRGTATNLAAQHESGAAHGAVSDQWCNAYLPVFMLGSRSTWRLSMAGRGST